MKPDIQTNDWLKDPFGVWRAEIYLYCLNGDVLCLTLSAYPENPADVTFSVARNGMREDTMKPENFMALMDTAKNLVAAYILKGIR